MSSPLTRAAATVWPKGPGQGTDNLTSLASNTAKGLGAVGTVSVVDQEDNVNPIRIKSGSGVSASGTASLYLVVSGDGVVWTNGIDPDSTGDQKSKLKPDFLIETISVTADATDYYFLPFSIFNKNNGSMPTFRAIVIYNQSGAALSATDTDHSATHERDSYA